MRFDPAWALTHDLPRFARRLPKLVPPVTRPAIWEHLMQLGSLEGVHRANVFADLFDRFEDELPTADLAELGFDLIARHRKVAERVQGCIWLTAYPSVETSRALATILRDPGEPIPLRDQAAWTLGFRQVQQRHASVHWPAEAVAIADEALLEALLSADAEQLEQLPLACRHVGASWFHDRVAEALDEGSLPLARVLEITESFASPTLARRLLHRLSEVDSAHSSFVVPLLGDVLREEALEPLSVFARLAADQPTVLNLEATWAVQAIDAEAGRPLVHALVTKLRLPPHAARARWQEANPGVFPIPEAVRVGRTTAVLAPEARRSAARRAAELLAMLAALPSQLPQYVAALSRDLAALAGPEAVAACVTHDPFALTQAPRLVPIHLAELARLGRFDELEAAARAHDHAALATFLLASHGRPFRALSMRRLARSHDVHAVAGQALALFMAGRPDLAQATVDTAPAPEADALWRANRRPEEAVLRAWLAEAPLAQLCKLSVPPPPGAGPDRFDFDLLRTTERSLRADVRGASVFLAGRFDDRPALEARLVACGARILSAAFGKVEFLVLGENAPAEMVARLVSLGAVSISPTQIDSLPADTDTRPRLPSGPHRVAFLGTELVLPKKHDELAPAIGALLRAHYFESFVRHREIAVSDLADEPIESPERFDLDDDELAAQIDWELRVNRRAEVLALSISLDPARPEPGRLRVFRPGKAPEDFTMVGGETSMQIAKLFELWLESRGLEATSEPPPFTARELLDAAGAMRRARGQRRGGKKRLEGVSPGLATPFCLTMSMIQGSAWAKELLRLDPKHPVALRTLFIDSLDDADSDRHAILEVARAAPNYGKPHLSVHGEAFEADSDGGEHIELHHQSVAATLLPANPYALHNYASTLDERWREAEAYRWATRTLSVSPGFFEAYPTAIQTHRSLEQPGATLMEASHLAERVGANLPGRSEIGARLLLMKSFALSDVGRLDEAIELWKQAIAELDDPVATGFGWTIERLETWTNDPEWRARHYAREGWHRGDPGRVLQGFAHAVPQSNEDAWYLLDALIELGHEDLARVAAAQFLARRQLGAKGRLLAARAEIVAGGSLDVALDALGMVHLRAHRRMLEAETNRLLRIACCRAPEDWDAAIARRLDLGARSVARMSARDLADFVPGMALPATLRALGPRAPWQLDPVWLDAFARSCPALDEETRAALDARLARPESDTLEAADRLAADWFTVLPPAGPDETDERWAAASLYALGLAYARYFEATSGAPTPIAGAWRHVAAEALALCARARGLQGSAAERGLLELLERVAERLPIDDEALFDTWLLRLERALELDLRHGAYLTELVDGLPKVAYFLRGDERVALELRTAWALSEDPDTLGQAAALFARCARAIENTEGLSRLSEIADAAMRPADALDVHWLAAYANVEVAAVGWVNAARALLRDKRVDPALVALSRAFRLAGDEWRDRKIAELAELWAHAEVDVPFSFDAAQAEGMSAAQRGDWARALRCWSWNYANDPKNDQIARNLGFVHTRLGNAYEAVYHFARADAATGAKTAGFELYHALHFPDAVLVLRWAEVLGQLRAPDDWRALAVGSWQSKQARLSSRAFERMLAAGGEESVDNLHGFVTMLHDSGQWVHAEELARRILRRELEPAYAASVENSLAGALAGQGDFDGALAAAKRAEALNVADERRESFAASVRRYEARELPPLSADAVVSAEERAFAQLASGDFEAVRALSGEPSWRLRRAELAASTFRYDDEADIPVTKRAIEAASRVLEASVGACELDAVLARVRALALRESAFIAIDPPAQLGSRMKREDFEAMYRVGETHWPIDDAADAQPGDGDDDAIVFPGEKVARLSDYVALMKRLQAGEMDAALREAGLDMTGYAQVGAAWGARLAKDPELAAKLAAQMRR